MKFILEERTTPVVYEDDMHFSTRTRLAEMRGESGRRLAGSTTGKKAVEHSKRPVVWDDFFDTHRSNMKLRHRGRHVRITLICTYHYLSGLSYAEIGSGKSGICRKKFVSEALTGTICQICRITVTFFAAEFLFEKVSDLFL